MTCDRKIGPFDCCSVVQGDCLELMKQLPDGCVDAVITDPPYGIDGGRGGGSKKRAKGTYDFAGGWSDDESNIVNVVVPVLRQCRAKGMRIAVTPGNRCLFSYDRPEDVGCFWSPADSGHSPWGMICFHPILFYGKDPRCGTGALPTGRYIQGNAPDNGHPCPKPEKEWQWLAHKASKEGETILDPFCGSGTTLVAAKKLGRHYLGFEISPEYCAIARDRIARVEAQPNLFEPKPEQMTIEGSR